ncbi:cytidine deaminase-like [Hyla sarda]|uniref:cytidine deaminase-like n=1 Tax=Hyla sarda TaxID=327740 RepID=UPI0024C213DC|nr:cytidine deaminase-like [Hyla sarda]
MIEDPGVLNNGESHDRALMPDLIHRLVQKSQKAKAFGHCPYIHFLVRAALLDWDGMIFLGCNVENACYSLGICTERTAIQTAASKGSKYFAAIAVASDVEEEFTTPCRACQQVIRKFGSEWWIVLTMPSGSYIIKTLGDLLPFSFGPVKLAMK